MLISYSVHQLISSCLKICHYTVNIIFEVKRMQTIPSFDLVFNL